MPNALIRDPTTQLPADFSAGFLAPPGYIDGMKMVWNSATSISVTSGAIGIQSLGYAVPFSSTLTLSSLSLSASTFYHLYGYLNSGTPAIELVTTAPATAYSGTARAKTGDTSRRYLGSVLTDASGNVIQFQMNGNTYTYNLVSAFSLNNGTATTSTNISLAAFIPSTGTHGKITIGNGDSVVQVRLSTSNAGPTNIVVALSANNNLAIDMPLTSTQTMSYAYASTPTNGCFVRVFGYLFER